MKTVSRGRIVAFALLLLVAIVAGLYTSGGKFGGLGSSYLNNPNFVCTQASLISGEVQYNQSTADIERLMVEKTALEKQAQSGKADISKQEAQVRRGEAQKKSADNTVKTLDNYIDKNCSASALKSLQNPRNNTRFTERQKICDQKKKELRDAKQDARKLQTQITQQKSALATLNSTITKAQADIISLGKKIKSTQDFVEDYETCKRSFAEKPIISGEVSIANFDLIVSGEVFVNQPFDVKVRALNASGTVNDKYQGKVFFDTNNNPADVILPFQESDGGSEYLFSLTDNGVHIFRKGFTIKKPGLYELTVFELNGPNGGINKTISVMAIEKNTVPGLCTDSDEGRNPFISGHTEGPVTLGDGVINFSDTCFQAESLANNDPLIPIAIGFQGNGESCEPGTLCYVKEGECVDKKVMIQNIPCPNGCSKGSCRKWKQ